MASSSTSHSNSHGSAAASPIGRLIAHLLHKDIPMDSESYMGASIAISGLTDGPADEKHNAAKMVATIARHHRYRLQLIRSGAVPLLVDLLYTEECETSWLQATAALMELALDKRAHDAFYVNECVPRLLALLRNGSDDTARGELVCVIQSLLVSPPIRMQFIEANGLSTMVEMMKTGADQLKEQTAFVLWILAANTSMQPFFVKDNAIPSLIALLSDGSGEQQDAALGTLLLLAEQDECRREMLHGQLDELVADLSKDRRHDFVARVGMLQELLRSSDK